MRNSFVITTPGVNKDNPSHKLLFKNKKQKLNYGLIDSSHAEPIHTIKNNRSRPSTKKKNGAANS
jgi:hypothetical protein